MGQQVRTYDGYFHHHHPSPIIIIFIVIIIAAIAIRLQTLNSLELDSIYGSVVTTGVG
jgi:hypothetical protein